MTNPVASTGERAGSHRICTQLHHAYRGLRLYPADHPSAAGSIAALVETVAAHLQRFGPLVLGVEETCLLYGDEEVYSFAESRDNLAFIMFRDGIRSLSFHPGVESDELSAFVSCLAHADDLADEEQDLATALWEQDFAHIDYVLADPFLGGAVLREGTVDALRETVLRRLDEVKTVDLEAARSPDGCLTAADHVKLDLHSIILTAEEIERSEKAVAEDSGALKDFVLVLLEIIADPAGSMIDEATTISTLSMAFEHYLDRGDLDGCRMLIGGLQDLEGSGRLADGFIDRVVGEALTADCLGNLLEGVGQASPARVAEIESFLEVVRPWTLPALLELLVETDDRGVRKVVLDALQMENGVPSTHIWPLLHDPRWYVVRNAVQLIAGSSDEELPGRLEGLLRHPDVRVRREVVRTLDTLEGTRSVQALVRALDDADPSVRVLAARSLGRHGDREHYCAILAAFDPHDLDARSEEEVEALLGALAALGGERALTVLDELWRRRRLRARPVAVRLASLHAIGSVKSPEAVRMLKEAARSRETQVRRAASRILRQGAPPRGSA